MDHLSLLYSLFSFLPGPTEAPQQVYSTFLPPQARTLTRPLRTALAVSFSREFPAEVLLVIFAHLLPACPTLDSVGSTIDVLRDFCLVSRSFNELATGILYSHLVFATRRQTKAFVRTAASPRWTTGVLAGNPRVYNKAIASSNKTKWSSPFDGAIERVLGVVDPSSILSFGVCKLYLSLDVLAPLTNRSNATPPLQTKADGTNLIEKGVQCFASRNCDGSSLRTGGSSSSVTSGWA